MENYNHDKYDKILKRDNYYHSPVDKYDYILKKGISNKDSLLNSKDISYDKISDIHLNNIDVKLDNINTLDTTIKEHNINTINTTIKEHNINTIDTTIKEHQIKILNPDSYFNDRTKKSKDNPTTPKTVIEQNHYYSTNATIKELPTKPISAEDYFKDINDKYNKTQKENLTTHYKNKNKLSFLKIFNIVLGILDVICLVRGGIGGFLILTIFIVVVNKKSN